MLPAFEIIEGSSLFKRIRNSKKYPKAKSYVMRTIMVMFTGVVASLVPRFGLFVALIGSFTCTVLAFIMPVLMYNAVFKDSIPIAKKRFHIALVVFGVFCGTVSFVISSIDLINAFSVQQESTQVTGSAL